MPRKARIDALGALHHIIGLVIERRKIFLDDVDRDDFVQRLGTILSDTVTSCFAWSLLPNHYHLLLRTGNVPIATVMRRDLGSYQVKCHYISMLTQTTGRFWAPSRRGHPIMLLSSEK